MKKTVRLCDVCGEEIPWHADRYRFKTYHYPLYAGEIIKCSDMCSKCYTSFITFVKQKRSDCNA